MSWAKLLAEKKVKEHTPNLSEINNLRDLIARDIKDAKVEGLSPDRSFAIAYNAALQTAQMVVVCSGYRISSIPGHHIIAATQI